MISFFQKLRSSVAASTGLRQAESTRPAEEHSLVSRVIWDWPKGEPVRVDVALERYPQLKESPRAVVELAIEEFNERRNAGEVLSATAFAARFPDVRSQLLDSLVIDNEFQSALQEMSRWLQSVLTPGQIAADWPEVGDEVAGFELVESLGQGGFSRVFVARETGYENRQVAVKFCRKETHEARTLATLTHSGIGAVHYVRPVPETGMTAICMPLTSRTTLSDIVRRTKGRSARPTSATEVWEEVRTRNGFESPTPEWAQQTYIEWAQELMIGLAEALAASHAQDVVHCDLKPTNVLVTAEGKPTLVDFNVAFRRSAIESPANVGGTLPYMAPEQIGAFAGNGFGSIGPATDVYGLAATIYEVLTGRLPFGSATPADDGLKGLLERRRTRPESICAVNPQVTPEFEALLFDCLEYETERRPQSAEALMARLSEVRRNAAADASTSRRQSAIRMTVAAAGLLLAVAILPSRDPAENSSNGPAAVSNQGTVQATATREEVVAQLVVDGYDAFEAKEFKKAETLFADAIDKDPGHEGAVIGWIRANFHQGNVEAVERAGVKIFNDGTPEKAALRGLCHAGVENHPLAIPSFRTAVNGGLATKEVLTDLGYSLYRSGEYDEAIEVLERVRSMGGDTSTANLILVRAYPMVWQRRVRGKPAHTFDEQLLVSLIEQSTDSPAKFFVASQIYASFVRRLGRNDPEVAELWGNRALMAIKQGCELGLDPASWNGVRRSLPESVLNSPLAAQFDDVPEERAAPQHRAFFLLDPLVGSRFDRYTERKLTADDLQPIAKLVAVADEQ